MVVAVNDRKGQIVAIQLTYVTQTGRKSPHKVIRRTYRGRSDGASMVSFASMLAPATQHISPKALKMPSRSAWLAMSASSRASAWVGSGMPRYHRVFITLSSFETTTSPGPREQPR